MERLKGLDGIRGVLALLVALTHAFGHYTGWSSGIFPLTNVSFCVDIFFILSGIVLCHVYQKSISSSELGLWDFTSRRILRLYPMHIFCMALVPLIFFISSSNAYPEWLGESTPLNILGDSLLLNTLSIGFDFVSNQPSWSISIELYIGTFLAFYSCKYRCAPLIIALVAVMLAYHFGIKPKEINKTHAFLVNGGIIRCLYSMSAGVIAYRIVRRYKSFFEHYNATSNLIGIMGVIIMFLTIHNIRLSSASYFTLVSALSLAIAIIGVIGCKSLSFFDSKLFTFLGVRSFSIYLLHTPMLYAFLGLHSDNNMTNSILAVSIILLTVSASSLTYRYIEKPFIRRSHKINQASLKTL